MALTDVTPGRQLNGPDRPSNGAPPDPAVLIVGAGPTGLTIANFLGQAGIPTLVVERNATTTDEPKAVSIDEESLRLLQAVGLYERLQPVLMPGTGTRYYGIGGVEIGAARGPNPPRYGHPIKNELNQPDFERALLEGAQRFPCVQVRFDTELVNFQQDADGVVARLADRLDPERTHSVRSQILVGTDGGRSTVRKQLGTRMLGSSVEEPWVVLDTRNDPHTVRYAMHHGDPYRPHVIIPGRDGLCRYEFLLLPGEDPDEMLRLERLQQMVAPYRRLEADDIVRSKVYTFHVLVAEQWRLGRVVIAGDAAHMMPPFAGQGLNSGLRDAHNLSWKLVMLLQGRAGLGLLDSYQRERRAHAEAMIAMSVRMGKIVMTRNRARAVARDAFFRTVGQVGPIKRYVTEMRYKPEPRYREGLMVGPRTAEGLAGSMLPQPPVLFLDGQVRLLDDALGEGFALIGLARQGQENPFARLRHPVWQALQVRRLAVYPEDRWPAHIPPGARPVVDVDNRLVPEFWPRTADPARLLLVRPDRYVAGAFNPADEARCGNELVAQLDARG